MKAINFVEYDKKTDTSSIRLTGTSPKYTIQQRIDLMAASEDMYEALKQSKADLERCGLTTFRVDFALAKADKNDT